MGRNPVVRVIVSLFVFVLMSFRTRHCELESAQVDLLHYTFILPLFVSLNMVKIFDALDTLAVGQASENPTSWPGHPDGDVAK